MLEKYCIHTEHNVKDAIELLDKNEFKVVFIVGKDNYLEGIFTQGDMRRYILHSNDLTQNIKKAMNPSPIVFKNIFEAQEYKKNNSIIVYPIINEKGQLIDAVFQDEAEKKEKINDSLKNVPLVIMAGGKGTRLYPYTKILPKALIPIGDFTISERIINQFRKYGCQKVVFILNHKANMIQAYFNELERDYTVDYVVEKEFLGTGGGLQLLKGKVDTTFILSNCDILINDDLECIYTTHKKNKNKITFVCAAKNVTIPYGVIKTDETGNILEMQEKPEFSFLTNTGVYIIEPDIIDDLNENEFIHLPDIAQRYIENGEKVGVFPISEKSWLDMGQFGEMENMVKALEK